MTPEIVSKIISKFGGQTKLAAELGCTQSAIAHWKRRGAIPSREISRILQAAERLGIELDANDFFRAA